MAGAGNKRIVLSPTGLEVEATRLDAMADCLFKSLELPKSKTEIQPDTNIEDPLSQSAFSSVTAVMLAVKNSAQEGRNAMLGTLHEKDEAQKQRILSVAQDTALIAQTAEAIRRYSRALRDRRVMKSTA